MMNKLSNRQGRILSYALLVVVLLGLPLMILNVQQSQDRRSRADSLATVPGTYGYGGYSNGVHGEGELVTSASATPTIIVSTPSATPEISPENPTPTSSASSTPLPTSIATLTPTSIPTNTPTPTPTSVPVNLILNPGFESGNTSWSNWGNSGAVSNNAYSGSYAMRSGTKAGGRYQQISQSAGTYTLSACGKVSKSGETGWIGVDYLNSAGTKIGSNQKFTYTGTGYSCPTTTFTAPTDTATLKVWLWKNAGNGGYFYGDNLSLFKQ